MISFLQSMTQMKWFCCRQNSSTWWHCLLPPSPYIFASSKRQSEGGIGRCQFLTVHDASGRKCLIVERITTRDDNPLNEDFAIWAEITFQWTQHNSSCSYSQQY
jgi:hypothetical protein